MRWENFHYLLPFAAIAVILLMVMSKLVPRLSIPSQHRTRLEIFTILMLSAFGLAVIYWNFFISKTYFVYNIGDVGSDTTEQYYPFYLWLIDKVREGKLSAWTFDFELGVNLQSFQSWLFDPFNLVVVPLGLLLGNGKLSLVLTISQSVKLILSALLFDHLLTRYCETPLSRVAGSLLYAFNGYMILYGQHYWLGGAVPIFTATILLFELLLEEPTWQRMLGTTLVVAVQLAWSAYVSFMVLLAAAIYLLLRLPYVCKGMKPSGYLKRIGILFLPVICGFLVSCVSCVPYANFLLNETGRTTTTTPLATRFVSKLKDFVHADWIPAILSRTLGTGLINTGAGTVTPTVSDTPGIGMIHSFPYEFILMGYSCGCFLLLGQFFHWVATESTWRERIGILLATVLVFLYCFHELPCSVFTMMVRTSFRSCFVIAIPICIAMTIGFDKRVLGGEIALAPFVVCLLFTFGVLAWSLVNTLNGRLICLFYIAATVACGISIYTLRSQERFSQLATAVLIAAMLSSSVVDGLFCTSCRTMVEPWGLPYTPESGDTTWTDTILDYLRENDDTFWRMDKDDFSNWTPLNDSLIQHYASVSAYNSSADDDVDVFYHLLWKEAISTWSGFSQGYRNNPGHPELMSILNLKYVLSLHELDADWLRLDTNIGDVYVYENINTPSLATLRRAVVSESEADALPDSEARRALLEDAVIVPDDIAKSWQGTDKGDGAASPAVFYIDEDESHMHGTIDAATQSVVCLSIPHTGTWDIIIDGVKQEETFRANYGFYGFVIDAGTHNVELSYHIDGLPLGIALTVWGSLLTLAICIAMARSTKSTSPRQSKHAA